MPSKNEPKKEPKKICSRCGQTIRGEYVKMECGLSESAASRHISRMEQFSEGGDSPKLSEKWSEYSVSQLQEILYLTDEQREAVGPDMTVKEIREIRKPEPRHTTVWPSAEDIGQAKAAITIQMPEQADIGELRSGYIEVAAEAEIPAGEELATPQENEECIVEQEPELGETEQPIKTYDAHILQELIEETEEMLNAMADYWRESQPKTLTKYLMMVEAYELLREKHERQNGWISVREQLPEEPGVYLVFFKKNNPPTHDAEWKYRKNIIDCGDYYFETCTRWYGGLVGERPIWSGYEEKILAWQPLPEPYRGE